MEQTPEKNEAACFEECAHKVWSLLGEEGEKGAKRNERSRCRPKGENERKEGERL